MAKYRLTFPRIEEDILSKKRTLVHLPCTEDLRHYEFQPGDIMSISAEYTGPTVARAVFIDVTKCHIHDSVAGDLALLNLPAEGLDTYRTRWDTVNPDVPLKGNPLVWRIVFHYLPDQSTRTRKPP